MTFYDGKPEFYGDILIQLKKIVGSNIFSAQFIKIFSHYKKIGITLMYCNRLHAWWSAQSRLATLLSSLIARWRVGLTNQSLSVGRNLMAFDLLCLPKVTSLILGQNLTLYPGLLIIPYNFICHMTMFRRFNFDPSNPSPTPGA